MNNSNPHGSPPKWAISFLEWFCPDGLFEGILGDLQEQYETDCIHSGKKANRQFIWNVLRMFHPSIILRNYFSLNLLHMGMLINHFKVAYRSLKKYAFFSVVNIFGLSLAIAFIFLSFLFVQSELAFDQFHTKKDHVYRLYTEIVAVETGLVKNNSAVTSIPLARDLHSDIADIQEYTRVASGTSILTVDGVPYEEIIHYADPGFLQMFDFPMQKGNEQALNQPNSIVISTEKATKYFGYSNPLGKTVTLKINEEQVALKIAGVIDPKKEYSSTQFDFLAPMEIFKKVVGEQTFNSYKYALGENYILSKNNYSREEFEALLSQTIQKYVGKDDYKLNIGLQPLSSIHLEDQIVGNAVFTSPTKLYIMAGLALLVLIIAVINFLMLSTSHAMNRVKEIGIRSTLGALKGQLKRQMISESFFVTSLSCFIGVALASTTLPTFGQLIESAIPFSFGTKELLFVLGLCLLIAWTNGTLQALFLVKSNAIHSLKGSYQVKGKNNLFNKSLLVLQFSLSIMLIVGALGIRLQMQYIQNKDLGYDTERLIEISMNSSPDTEAARHLVDRFKTKALQHQQILSVSASMNNCREPWTKLSFEQTEGEPEGLFYNQVHPEYLQTMNIELLQGGDFRANGPNSSKAILVNEALVSHFGWEEPFGQQIPGKNFDQKHQIIGVVKDFHFSSLHQQIEPLILAIDLESVGSGITGLSTYIWPANLYQILVRVGPGELSPVINQLEQIWQEVALDKAFVYHFVDEALEARYAQEKRWSKVMNLASLFAIFIAWLGLVALMRLSVRQRFKEIGIRKILGASTAGIIHQLSKQYLLLIIIGNIIALPISWLLMEGWLESFSYSIELNPSLFFIAGIAVLLFALISMAMQSIKAASLNPVETLRVD